MTFIFVATDDWYLYNFKLPIAERVREEGHEVILVTPRGEYAEQFEERGFRWIPVDHEHHGLNPFGELRFLWQLIRLYRRLEPDVVHHFNLKGLVHGSIAGKLTSRKSIFNSIGGGTGIAKYGHVSDSRLQETMLKTVLYPLVRIALPGTHAIFQNSYQRNELVSRGFADESRAHLVKGSGADTDEFAVAPLPEETPPIVLLVGRMLWGKGVGEFVEASKLLRRSGEDARFVMVGGTQPDHPSAVPEEKLREWVDRDLVEWWGFCEDMPRTYQKATLVCLPTRFLEGIPKTLIEAASCGRPIVTTDAPGCNDIVRDGVNGRLVPTEDPEALSRAIAELLSDRDELERMGREGRRRVEMEFSLERVVEQVVGLYRELVPGF